MEILFEITDLELSGKTAEELASLQKDLNEQKRNANSERLKATKIVRLCDSELRNIDKELAIILKETKRREDIEEAKHIINEDIRNIEGFTLLSEDEFSIITNRMDRTDYRKHGNYPRFLDLERICNEVITMKKRYTKWTLTNLERGGQYDTLPPKTFYKYEYKDDEGCNFDIGGFKLSKN